MLDFPGSPTLGQQFTGPNGIFAWDGGKWAPAGVGALPFLPLAGGTMTGPLTLSADPAAALQPVTLQYFNAHYAGGTGPYLPLAGGTLTGPLNAVGLSASGTVSGAGFTTLLAPYAPLASPVLTGTPAAPTATAGTNTTQLATTAFVTTAVPVASSTLPIMDGTAAVGTGATWARADHVHPTDTTLYPMSNPSGYVNAADAATAAPVQSVATRTGAVTLTHTDITDWTTTLAAYAPINSPTFTGTVALPGSFASTGGGFDFTAASGVVAMHVDDPTAAHPGLRFSYSTASNTWTLSGTSNTNILIAPGGAAQFQCANVLITGGAISATTIAATTFTTAYSAKSGTSYSVAAADCSLVITPTAAFTITLGTATAGRVLNLLNQAAFAISSATANVVPLAGGSAATTLLAATAGKFCTLQGNGTNWQIMNAN